jgi:hypothetical protein
MRTFELRVYTLRTKEALDFYMEQIYPRHLSSFPLFGIEAHGFWTVKEDVEPRFFVLASYAAGEEPCEVARRYMQSTEFAEYQTSLALNRQSSYLQRAPLLNDGKRKQREQMNTTTGFGGRNLNSFQGVVYGGIHDGSPKCRCNYRRWIDSWM